MEFIIGGYLALMASSYACGKIFDKAYDVKLKRLGYISTEPELYGWEARIRNVKSFLGDLSMCFVPFLNFLSIFMLFTFEDFSDSMIRRELQEKSIKKIDPKELKQTPEEGYLQRRIAEVKKFQSEMGHKNVPRPYSELSYDEKIDLLLQELRFAYEEKAKAEGIDLTEVEHILEAMPSDSTPKSLKKTN